MLQISIPVDNINERCYILGVIFRQFLGLEYSISANESNEGYSIGFNGSLILLRIISGVI